MEDVIAVSGDHISMKFNLVSEKVDSIKEYIIKAVKEQISYNEFWALKNISFEIKKGEAVGIVGLNGSGKSTLLKIIAGVLTPTCGKLSINGSIAPLIELGAGFDYELTARENIYLNGAILGFSRKKINAYYNDIVSFSELGEFIDVPVKNFSSGMISRLGFSIATIGKPDILIVDEVLSVGDFRFQIKCEERIRKMLRDGTTLLFVSHSIKQVEQLCSNIIWLDSGYLKMQGDSGIVAKAYRQSQ